MTETTAKTAKPEPHEFEPPADGTRDAGFGWCARGDCGVTADAYVHASEEERRRFDSQQAATAGHRKQAEAMHFASITGRHEARAEGALADLETAVARAQHLLRARQRGSADWRQVASGADKISRAAADFAAAAEALRALGEVSWIAAGTEGEQGR
jgi:hypothetical protein